MMGGESPVAGQAVQPARWCVSVVDRSTESKLHRSASSPEASSGEETAGLHAVAARAEARQPLPTRRQRQISLIMQIVEAARFQRIVLGATHCGSHTPPVQPRRLIVPGSGRRGCFPLLDAKHLKDLVSDVLLLMGPTQEEDYTTETTRQILALNLFQPSTLQFE